MPAPRDLTAPVRPTELREALEGFGYTWLRFSRESAAADGLTLPQFFLLNALARGGSVPVTQLAAGAGAPPSTITGIIDGLEQAGLARRHHGVEDRRQVLVSLSSGGRRLAARVAARQARTWASALAAVEAGTARQAASVVGRVTDGLRGTTRDPPTHDASDPPSLPDPPHARRSQEAAA